MIESKLVAMLRCPESGQQLEIADDSLLKRLNEAIDAGQLRGHQEQRVTRRLEAGLVTANRQRLYPIWDQIPTMILDESIPLGQLAD